MNRSIRIINPLTGRDYLDNNDVACQVDNQVIQKQSSLCTTFEVNNFLITQNGADLVKIPEQKLFGLDGNWLGIFR